MFQPISQLKKESENQHQPTFGNLKMIGLHYLANSYAKSNIPFEIHNSKSSNHSKLSVADEALSEHKASERSA